MLESLIPIAILILILFIAFWVIDMIPFPPNINMIVKVIVGLIILIKVLSLLGLNFGKAFGKEVMTDHQLQTAICSSHQCYHEPKMLHKAVPIHGWRIGPDGKLHYF